MIGQSNNALAFLLKRWIPAAIILVCALCAASAATIPGTVTLAWAPTPGAVGYMIYLSKDGTHYGQPIDGGSAPALTFNGLQPGSTNFFYVTAYDSNGVEGAASSPIAYIVPIQGGLTMAAKQTVRSPAKLSFPIALGHTYKVEASSDLVHWSTVWQTNATATGYASYSDPLGATLKMRFYRTVSN